MKRVKDQENKRDAFGFRYRDEKVNGTALPVSLYSRLTRYLRPKGLRLELPYSLQEKRLSEERSWDWLLKRSADHRVMRGEPCVGSFICDNPTVDGKRFERSVRITGRLGSYWVVQFDEFAALFEARVDSRAPKHLYLTPMDEEDPRTVSLFDALLWSEGAKASVQGTRLSFDERVARARRGKSFAKSGDWWDGRTHTAEYYERLTGISERRSSRAVDIDAGGLSVAAS